MWGERTRASKEAREGRTSAASRPACRPGARRGGGRRVRSSPAAAARSVARVSERGSTAGTPRRGCRACCRASAMRGTTTAVTPGWRRSSWRTTYGARKLRGAGVRSSREGLPQVASRGCRARAGALRAQGAHPPVLPPPVRPMHSASWPRSSVWMMSPWTPRGFAPCTPVTSSSAWAMSASVAPAVPMAPPRLGSAAGFAGAPRPQCASVIRGKRPLAFAFLLRCSRLRTRDASSACCEWTRARARARKRRAGGAEPVF